MKKVVGIYIGLYMKKYILEDVLDAQNCNPGPWIVIIASTCLNKGRVEELILTVICKF